jgi:hypothetical protein
MIKILLTLSLLLASFCVNAAVEISDAWARATPPGQDVGAAYMNLKSDRAAKLIGASTPVADSVEFHEMSMNNGVMKMRMLETVALPAGKIVKLAPGGFHLMLFDLKKPLTAGETIAIELTLKDAKGKTTKQKVSVPVKADNQ